uniref:hypothetical protein n=1 Tax=Drechslerella dactyloides TaxID=74499 RepID=UPI0022FD9225|nr:hypothetical protein PNX16_mgp018 [Drechslerella dactyloides]WAN89833.1 hypothetical protein [Drechslerella dactyloides]
MYILYLFKFPILFLCSILKKIFNYKNFGFLLLVLSIYMNNYVVGDIIDNFVLLSAIVPIKLYANADIKKLEILKENKGKSGVYRWKNNISGKSYVGSSVNLYIRFLQYFSTNHLIKKTQIEKSTSLIYNSLLKYGYSNFQLEILEYCTRENCIERENYYIKLLNPEYNILPAAGSSLGYIHSDESRAKIVASRLGKKHSKEIKAKISVAMQGKNNPIFGKIRAIGAGKPSQNIIVIDLEKNTETIYNSLNEAATALGIRRTGISTYLYKNQQKPFKERFIFKRVD